MDRLILHVGPHKTGTTSIQATFYGNRQLLLADGIIYPESIDGAQFPQQHSDVAFAVMSGERECWRNYFNAIFKRMVEEGIGYSVFSGEEFSALAFSNKRDEFFEFLSVGGNATFVYTKREVKDLILSALMQHLFGEVGFYFKSNYDLDRLVVESYEAEMRRREYFKSIGAVFLGNL